jgi:hypothetical protein
MAEGEPSRRLKSLPGSSRSRGPDSAARAALRAPPQVCGAARPRRIHAPGPSSSSSSSSSGSGGGGAPTPARASRSARAVRAAAAPQPDEPPEPAARGAAGAARSAQRLLAAAAGWAGASRGASIHSLIRMRAAPSPAARSARPHRQGLFLFLAPPAGFTVGREPLLP